MQFRGPVWVLKPLFDIRIVDRQFRYSLPVQQLSSNAEMLNCLTKCVERLPYKGGNYYVTSCTCTLLLISSINNGYIKWHSIKYWIFNMMKGHQWPNMDVHSMIMRVKQRFISWNKNCTMQKSSHLSKVFNLTFRVWSTTSKASRICVRYVSAKINDNIFCMCSREDRSV